MKYLTKKETKRWKQEAKTRFARGDPLSRKTARDLGVPWSSLWKFKQDLLTKQAGNGNGPRILHVDIETAPLLVHNWSLWQSYTGLNQIMEDWFMLSWAASWEGSDEVIYADLIQDKAAFQKDPTDDERVIRKLWELFDEADIIVGHNIKKFDNKKSKARFLKFGLRAPSPYRMVDTLEIAKREFSLASNKLDWLATFLGLPNKVNHEGHELWVKCMQGDEKAWSIMQEYNKYDVVLLKSVYHKIRGWSGNHVNVAVFYNDTKRRCPVCGSTKVKLMRKHHAYTNLSKFKAYKCNDCGKVARGGETQLSVAKRKTILRNIV